MPPGIGDETLDVMRLVKKSEFLVITTPSKVAMGAVRKLLQLLKELNLPVIGVIENMKMIKSNYIKDIVSKIDFTYLNSISYDKNLEESIGNPNKLLNTLFMKDFEKIVKKIMN